MKVTLSAPSNASFRSAYAWLSDAPIAVGLVAVPVLNTLPPGIGPPQDFRITLKNVSPAGQLIRIGPAPLFGPPNAGYLLNPPVAPVLSGDELVLDAFNWSISAIANAAGGLLEALIEYRIF